MPIGDRRKIAIIIGAGPAGLTAAYELLQRTDIHPVIIEMGERMGGLAQTVNYKGYRMDLGGHRFFSKSDRVMRWWLQVLPLHRLPAGAQALAYQGERGPFSQESQDLIRRWLIGSCCCAGGSRASTLPVNCLTTPCD